MTTKFISRKELVELDQSVLAMPTLLLRSWGFDPSEPITRYEDFMRDGYIFEQVDHA